MSKKIMKTWNGYEIHDDVARNKVAKLMEQITNFQDVIEELPHDSSVTYLEWDGDVTGMEYIEVEENGESLPLLYKYSSNAYTKDELLGCTVTLSNSVEEESIVITEDMITDVDGTGKLLVIGMGYIYIATENYTLTEEEISVEFTKGLWIMSPLLLNGYIKYLGKQELKTLDIKFIPDELYTKIDERIDAYIEEALGGEY